jgi:3',5'-cyclic AMP phosphodiesterase CpdA
MPEDRADRPILIAQISDLHVKPRGVLAYDRVDTAAALTACVRELNRFAPAPDLVVASGDLVDDADLEEYDHLRELLRPLQAPLAVIPGNHDARAPLRAAFPDQPYAATAALNLIVPVGPLDIVLVDSSVPGEPHGRLDEQTLAWLDRTLAASLTRPALLFLHHPPFLTGIAHMDADNLRNAADLEATLRRRPRVRLVAAGHVHRAVLTSFAGIAATICPAPNHAVVLDLDGLLPPSLRIEPPGFHLHAWWPGVNFGNVVTHFVPIGNFDGPHPFFAAGKEPR